MVHGLVHKTCVAAGGAPNTAKLRVFRVQRAGTQLRLGAGSVPTILGSLATARSGLHLAQVPLLPDVKPLAQCVRAQQQLQRLRATIPRFSIAVILTLRCIMAFVVSKLDYVFQAMPPRASYLHKPQSLVHRIVRNALRLPQTFPRAVLWAPPEEGGLGVPHLLHRGWAQYLRGVYTLLNSRNLMLRASARHLWQLSGLRQHADMRGLRQYLAQFGAALTLLPHSAWTEQALDVRRGAAWTGGPVVVVSDGSFVSGTLAWGAVVADEQGILATTAGSLMVVGGHSTAAEWLGRYAGTQLVDTLGIPRDAVAWSLVDNQAATFSLGSKRSSGSCWLDAIRLAVCRWLAHGGVHEAYLPSQHVTGDTSWLSRLQDICDNLAKEALATARPFTLPFGPMMRPFVHLVMHGHIAVSTSDALDGVYKAAVRHTQGPQAAVTNMPATFSKRLHTAGSDGCFSLRWSLLHHAAPSVRPTCSRCPLCCLETRG